MLRISAIGWTNIPPMKLSSPLLSRLFCTWQVSPKHRHTPPLKPQWTHLNRSQTTKQRSNEQKLNRCRRILVQQSSVRKSPRLSTRNWLRGKWSCRQLIDGSSSPMLRCENSGETKIEKDQIRAMVFRIEEEMFRVYETTDTAYKNKFRSLLANISNGNNQVKLCSHAVPTPIDESSRLVFLQANPFQSMDGRTNCGDEIRGYVTSRYIRPRKISGICSVCLPEAKAKRRDVLNREVELIIQADAHHAQEKARRAKMRNNRQDLIDDSTILLVPELVSDESYQPSAISVLWSFEVRTHSFHRVRWESQRRYCGESARDETNETAIDYGDLGFHQLDGQWHSAGKDWCKSSTAHAEERSNHRPAIASANGDWYRSMWSSSRQCFVLNE